MKMSIFPGGTSASGKSRPKLIYVGFGITAPELGYDDYQELMSGENSFNGK